jgi:hypothetical protein
VWERRPPAVTEGFLGLYSRLASQADEGAHLQVDGEIGS